MKKIRWIASILMITLFSAGVSAQETVEIVEVAEEAPLSIVELATSLDTVWMLLAAMLVFFMQPGFALVEAGFTRTKNTANILMKNFVDFMLGSILFWFIGFGLMFGVGGFVGAPHFFDLEMMDKIIDNGLPIEGFLIFQTVFCATSATSKLLTRSYGRAYQILDVSRIHDFYQRTDLSRLRTLDMGWWLAQ